MRPNLLEQFHNTVTNPGNEHGARYEVAKCGCRVWFCPECCIQQGMKLRERLIPVLETFKGLIMVSLTVDPELFPDPKTAYLYTMDKRCISVTTQDLFRWNHLITRRYFYVVEWQKNTEQAHYHILYDATYIPWEVILMSWDKHRPDEAGPIVGNRPAFGTVTFSAPNFASPLHAARYATKYLIKVPEYGFPAWVLAMGQDRRIRRYSASRGLWGLPSKLKTEPKTKRAITQKSYAEKIAKCGDSVNVFETVELIDPETGEITKNSLWIGQLDTPSKEVLENLFDPGNPERSRRSLMAGDLGQAKRIIENAAGKDAEWLRFRKSLAGGSLN